MGNLSNLFISASFQSLLHLGNDSVISSSLVGIQDGFGNSIGVAVNSAGDLSLSGSLTASLQQGYVWVGDGNNKTKTVPTSSFGGGGSATWPVFGTPSGIVSGSSQINYPQISNIPSGIVSSSSQLTSSYDQRYALSGSTNLSSLNAFTSSQLTINSGYNAFTASVNAKFATIGTQSGSWGGGGSGSAIVGYATTGSNTFTGSQFINGGNKLFIQRDTQGANQYLRLGATDNTYNFAFIVTGSDQNPGQQVWGINTGGGVWANSFDAGVVFNNYVSSSYGVQIGRGTDDGAGRNAINISRLSGQTGIQINQTGVGASWFIGTRENNNGNLIISSSANDRYIEFASSSGWMEVYANQTNFNNNVAFRNLLQARNISTDLGNNYTAQFDIISGSNANISGSLYVGGNKQFNVGAFQSNITQSGSANVSQSMQFETTDISHGVSIASNSRITIANKGTYNIQFSAQIDRVSGSGTDTINIWLKKNGVNVPASAGAVTITGGALAAKAIAAWNYVVEANANDYYELAWQTTDTNIQLINVNASGNVPGIPSIILTVTQAK
jgi:hypothetical protein